MRLLLLFRSTSCTENWTERPSAPSYLAVYSSFVCNRQEVFKAERVRWISAPNSIPLFPVCISMLARAGEAPFLAGELVVWPVTASDPLGVVVVILGGEVGVLGVEVLIVGVVGGESSVLFVFRMWNPV